MFILLILLPKTDRLQECSHAGYISLFGSGGCLICNQWNCTTNAPAYAVFTAGYMCQVMLQRISYKTKSV